MRKLKVEQLVKDGWKDIDSVLYYQGLFYIPEIIWTEFISKHYDNSLIDYFDIEKTQELLA